MAEQDEDSRLVGIWGSPLPFHNIAPPHLSLPALRTKLLRRILRDARKRAGGQVRELRSTKVGRGQPIEVIRFGLIFHVRVFVSLA
jgi:hypothetical protein